MNESVLRQYKKLRKEGIGAKYALSIAKYNTKAPEHEFLAGLGTYDDVTDVVDGFDVRVRVVSDDDMRLGEDDVTGTFGGDSERGGEPIPDGAIPVPKSMSTYNTNAERALWYMPGNDDQKHAVTNSGADKVSRGMRDEVVREYLLARMYEDAHRAYYILDVTVSLDGEELGSASLGGIDTIPTQPSSPYFVEMAEELISEAIDQAKENAPAAAERARAHAATLDTIN